MVLVMVLALVLSIGILRGHGHVHGPGNRNLTVMESLTSDTARIQRTAWCLALVIILCFCRRTTRQVIVVYFRTTEGGGCLALEDHRSIMDDAHLPRHRGSPASRGAGQKASV